MKFPIKHNLRARLVIILFSSLIIGALTVGYFLFQHLHEFLHNRVQENLQKNLDVIEYALQKDKFLNQESSYLKKFADNYARILESRVTFIDHSGSVVADSDIPNDQLSHLGNHLTRPEIAACEFNAYGQDIRLSASVGQNLLYIAKKIALGAKRSGYIRLAFRIEKIETMLESSRNYFFTAGLLILLISSVLLWIFSKRITDNLFEIINKANKIAAGDLNTRIHINSKDELFRLSENLNNMAAKLSDSLKKLQRDKTNLNTVLSSVNDMIIAIDQKKHIRFYNQQASTLFIPTEEAIIGAKISRIILNKHLKSLINNFYQNPVLVKDDIEENNRILDTVITPLKIIGKKNEGAVIVLRDVTNYKMLEKIRREFVANVSHEFKTPIAAIRGYAETMLDWGLKDEKVSVKYAEKIVKQSQQLENLVSDLLELARIEKMQNIEFTPFNPVPVINEIITELRDRALEKKLQLNTDIKITDIEIFGDSEMFRSIIINLVDNAIKYTPEKGLITLEAESDNGQVVFIVSDTGIGIPSAEHTRIFERFYRVDKARSGSQGGTGLGLSIVKHLAELQKAEIKMDSRPGKGSSFKIWFKTTS